MIQYNAIVKVPDCSHLPFTGDDANFFSVSNQRPDLAIQDLRNFFVEKSTDPRPANIIFWECSNPRPGLSIQDLCFVLRISLLEIEDLI